MEEISIVCVVAMLSIDEGEQTINLASVTMTQKYKIDCARTVIFFLDIKRRMRTPQLTSVYAVFSSDVV